MIPYGNCLLCRVEKNIRRGEKERERERGNGAEREEKQREEVAHHAEDGVTT